MTAQPALSQSNRIGMYTYTGIGAIAAVAVAWQAIARVIEIAPGHDIPVVVPLRQAAQLPLGPDGASVTATVQQAIVTVPHPAPATLAALWAQPLTLAATLIAGIVIAALFCLRLARGRAFEKGTSRLAYAGALVLGPGWLISTMFAQMSANGALSAISAYSYESDLFETNWMVVFGVLALVAVGVALQIGERLRRDTEGLV